MSTISPTRIEIPLGGHLEFHADLEAGALVLDTEGTYTFEVTLEGRVYRAVGTFVSRYDFSTGVAKLQPKTVTLRPQTVAPT